MENKLTARQFLAIVAAGLFAFCGILIETATNITFPTLIDEFGVATSTVQWMTTGNLLAMGIVIPLSSYLDKRFSKRNLFIFAGTLFIAGIVVDVTTQSFTLLLLGRLIQGFAVGIALPLIYNIILVESPGVMLGRMMGMGSLVIATAPALGPTFGGWMIEYLGWRYIFAAMLPVISIALAIGSRCIDSHPGNRETRIDWKGYAAIACAFVALMFAFSNLDKILIDPGLVIGCFTAGILALLVFIRQSRKCVNPLIDLSIFSNMKFTFHLGAIMATQITTLALSFLLPIFVQTVLGQSAMAAGLVALPGSLVGAVFALVGGVLLDRYGPQKPIMAGALFAWLALIASLMFFNNLSYQLCVIFYFLYMVGVGLTIGNTLTCALNCLAKSQKGDGNAAIQTLQQLSGGIGTAICAASLAFFQNGTITSANTRSGALLVLALLMATVSILVLSQYKALSVRGNKLARNNES